MGTWLMPKGVGCALPRLGLRLALGVRVDPVKRSARCMYRCARSWAGVIRTGSTGSGAGAVCGGSAFGGSWRSGGGGPGAGTLFGGLALFLLPGGRPLRLGAVSGTAAAAGAGAGSGAGSTGAGAGSAGVSAGAGSAGSAGSGSGTASTFSSISSFLF